MIVFPVFWYLLATSVAADRSSTNAMEFKTYTSTLLENLLFSGHLNAYGNGASLRSSAGITIYLINCRFEAALTAYSNSGGAVSLANGLASFKECEFYNCWGRGCGGAIYCRHNISVTIDGCMFNYCCAQGKDTSKTGAGGTLYLDKETSDYCSLVFQNTEVTRTYGEVGTNIGSQLYANLLDDFSFTNNSFSSQDVPVKAPSTIYVTLTNPSEHDLVIKDCIFDNLGRQIQGFLLFLKHISQPNTTTAPSRTLYSQAQMERVSGLDQNLLDP